MIGVAPLYAHRSGEFWELEDRTVAENRVLRRFDSLFGREWRAILPNGVIMAQSSCASPWLLLAQLALSGWQSYTPSALPCYRYFPNGLHYRNLQPGSDREFYLTFVKNQIKFLDIMCPTAPYNADFYLYPRTFSLRG